MGRLEGFEPPTSRFKDEVTIPITTNYINCWEKATTEIGPCTSALATNRTGIVFNSSKKEVTVL